VCSFCLREEKSNPLGQFDRFLTCCDCGASGHPFCLKYSANLVQHLRSNKIKWQCIECKKCSVCLMTCESMLLCDRCDRGYHKECCQPPFAKRPKGSFVCHVCVHQQGLDQSTQQPSLNTSNSFSSKSTSIKKRKLEASKLAAGSNGLIDDTLLDASSLDNASFSSNLESSTKKVNKKLKTSTKAKLASNSQTPAEVKVETTEKTG
jgi:hypothetical protein